MLNNNRTIIFILSVLCCYLLIITIAYGIDNKRSHEEIVRLATQIENGESALAAASAAKADYEKAHADYEKEIETLNNRITALSNAGSDYRQDLHRTKERIQQMEAALKFYYEYCGILDYDRTYYHRFATDCAHLMALDRYYIYNIEAMPSRAKPCPYCYSRKANLPVDGLTYKY